MSPLMISDNDFFRVTTIEIFGALPRRKTDYRVSIASLKI
jgi:hypothetical protein